ncbi:MAG: ERCC4 domain-containing protein [Chloroflexota bacterium]
MPLTSILVDSREPDYIKQMTFGGVPTIVTLLEAGDLLAATDDCVLLLIERKTSNDFLNTLRDDRLFPQLSAMRSITPWCYLALTGALVPGPNGKAYRDGQESGWNWSSIAGALLSAQEIGVHILWIPSDLEFEAAIIRLGNRDRSQLRIQPARDTATLSEGEIVLSSLPGIGADKARALIDYCGSAADALGYLSDPGWDGPSAPGFAEGTKRRVRRALGLEGNMILARLVREEAVEKGATI